MNGSALETYLAGIDPRGSRVVISLDEAIRSAHPDFDVAIKYRILMYALRGDWRTWVCAIDVTTKGVGLRFLYGVLLDDPLEVLRAGSSVLKTWDLGFEDDVDAAAVSAYVGEAVARYVQYKESSGTVLNAARAATKSRARRRGDPRPGDPAAR